MLLFLTSQASETLDLIIPYLPKPPKNLRVAFVPTAAEPYASKPWMDDDRKKLVEMGFDVFDLDLIDKIESDLRNELENTDVIFVAGGNTFYLLEQVKKSGFDKVAKDLISKGVIYIGSSAGSVLAAPNIESVKIFDDVNKANLTSFEGLHLVDFVILPHYEKDVYYKEHEQVIEEYKERYTFILLTNKQAVLVQDDTYKIVERKILTQRL